MKFTSVLALIFIILKLNGNVDWSWWLVLSPLWVMVVLKLIAIVYVILRR